MANKTRRRKKSAPGEPFSRARKQEAQQQAVMSKNRRAQIWALIEQHCASAERLTQEAEEAAKVRKDYGDAGRLLREASNYLHLANAEKSKLPVS